MMPLLHFQTLGEGPPLILLHGLFGQGDNLKQMAKHFATNYQVILPDMLNHGQSFWHEAMDYPTMAKTIKQLLEHLSITEPIYLLGHSMGGKAAMQFANDYPDVVKKLIVLDIAPVTYPNWHSDIIAAMQKVADTAVKSRKEADAILEKVGDIGLRQFLLKSLKKNSQGQWCWQFNLPVIAAQYPSLAAAPLLTGSLNCPSLLVKGMRSGYITNAHRQAIDKTFSNLQFKMVEGAGHFLHVEKPHAVEGLVERFLRLQ